MRPLIEQKPTPEQLQGTLDAMRRRTTYRDWPATVDQVAQDPIRLNLLTINAWAAERAKERARKLAQQRCPRPNIYRPSATSFKMLAAGDTED